MMDHYLTSLVEQHSPGEEGFVLESTVQSETSYNGTVERG